MFLKFNKKITVIFGLIFGLFLVLLFNPLPSFAQETTGCVNKVSGVERYEACRINHGDTLTIHAEGCDFDCYAVINSTGKDIFVPTNTCAEWDSFLIHNKLGPEAFMQCEASIVFNAADKNSLSSVYEQPFIDKLQEWGYGVAVISDGEVAGYDYGNVDLLIIRPPGDNYTAHPESGLNNLPVNIISHSRHTSRVELGMAGSSTRRRMSAWYIDDGSHLLSAGYSTGNTVSVYTSSAAQHTIRSLTSGTDNVASQSGSSTYKTLASRLNGDYQRVHWAAHRGNILTTDGWDLYRNVIDNIEGKPKWPLSISKTGTGSGDVEATTSGMMPNSTLVFNRANSDRIPFSNVGIFAGNQNFTIEFWLYANSLPDPSYTSWPEAPVVMSLRGERQISITFADSQPGNVLGFRRRDTGNNWITVVTTNALNTHQWYHVAISYNPSSGWAMYVNGSPTSTSSDTSSILSYSATNYIADFDSDDRSFDGRVRDVRIWNTTRTQTQINDNKDIQLTGSESGLVRYWKLDEGGGTTAYDSTGNNNASIIGASWISGEFPPYDYGDISLMSCGAVCMTDVLDGTEVTLTATPDQASSFSGWSGGGCSGTGDCLVTVTNPLAITADFAGGDSALSVTKLGSGSGTVISDPTGIDCGSTCSANFDNGQTVDLTANPDTGHAFAGWSGDCSGTGTCQVEMTQSRHVEATFNITTRSLNGTISGSGTVNANPPNTNYSNSFQRDYDYGTSVTLTASAGQDYIFSGWSGACSGTGTCVVEMTADRSVTATFVEGETYNLSVSKSGAGSGTVTSDPSGINCGGTCSASFAEATSVTLSASAGTGSVFAGWSGEGCSGTGTCTVNMTANRSVTATFNVATHTLSGTIGGSGTVNVDPPNTNYSSNFQRTYDYGTSVTLSASAGQDYVFSGWSGACSGTGTCTVTMTANRSVTASFSEIGNYSLSVSKSGNGSGTVTSDPSGINCGATCSTDFADGTSVTLSASSDTSSNFAGWSGEGCSGTGTCSVSMTTNRSVTATFNLKTYTVTYDSNGGSCSPSSRTVNYGSSAAGPSCSRTGYDLTGFSLTSGSCYGTFSSSTGSCSNVRANMTIRANWSIQSRELSVTKDGSGSGTVTSNPSGISCGSTCSTDFNYGTSITLSASPASSSNFVGWHDVRSVSWCSGTGDCNISLTEDYPVSATFNLKTYTVTYDSNGGSCSPSSRTVNYGSSAAGPSCSRTGYDLTGFSLTSGSCYGTFSSSTGSCSNVRANMTIRANWEQEPPSSMPSSVSCSAGSSSISVSWGSVSGADEYEVWRKMLDSYYSYHTKVATTGSTSWTDNNADPGYEYNYYINPCNSAGCVDPDPSMGGSPSATCHVECTSHSQCPPNTTSCLYTKGTDCEGNNYSCHRYSEGTCASLCQESVVQQSHPPVLYGSNCSTIVDRMHGCRRTSIGTYVCYAYYCDSGGNFYQGEQLCTYLGSCAGYSDLRCFPYDGQTCAEGCDY